jgi:hypothetical protein
MNRDQQRTVFVFKVALRWYVSDTTQVGPIGRSQSKRGEFGRLIRDKRHFGELEEID